MKCEECRRDAIPITKENDWQLVMYFIDCLETEGNIEAATADRMRTAMMSFKAFAYDYDATGSAST